MADCKLFNIALRISEVFDGSNIQFVFNVSGYKCLYTHPFTAERKELFPYSTVKVQTSVLNLNTLFSMDDEFCSKTSNKQNPNEFFFSFSYLTFQDLYCRSVCQVQMYDLRKNATFLLCGLYFIDLVPQFGFAKADSFYK